MFEQLPGEEKKLVVLNGVGHWHCLEVSLFGSCFVVLRWRRILI